MTYTASTQGASATAAATFVGTLDPLLVAAGFAFVEQQTSGSETMRVYRSPSASNGVGDWYLVVRRTSDAASAVFLAVCEDYDVATHRMKKYIPNQGNVPNLAPLTPGYWVNDTTGVLTNTQLSVSVTISGTGFSYWLSANPSRVVLATRAGVSDSSVYAGLCDEVLPGTVAGTGFPLVLLDLRSTTLGAQANPSTVQMGWTREPAATSVVGASFGAAISSGTGWGYVNTAVDANYTGQGYAARVPVFTQRVNGGQSPRALLKDVLLYAAATSAVNGDTITASGHTYTRMGSGTQGPFWADQAA